MLFSRSKGPAVPGKQVSVTIIITVYKRTYLGEQLKALLSASVVPEEILILHYENHIDITSVVKQYRKQLPAIHVIDSDLNLKYFGRFSLAVHVKSEFTWVLDDDVIPGRKWLERCCEKCASLNAEISCTGRIIPKGDYSPERGAKPDVAKYFIGDCYNTDKMNYCPEDTVVDYACNSYFFKTEWVKDFWASWPYTLATGEDMHLSVTLKLRRNIDTVVLSQVCADTTGNLNKNYSRDRHSSWRKSDFHDLREALLKNMMEERGWKPLLWS
jgi:hypothetical protein